ncbi:MAG: aspartyl protease family protein [Thermonemataceae bacterium]|mgnify:CR=1 FL=1
MRYLLYTLIVITAACTSPDKQADDTPYLAQIDALIVQKDFFKARDLLQKHKDQLETYDKTRLAAYVDNAFNRLEASNKAIEALFTTFKDQLTDSLRADLLEIQSQNHIKLQNYEEAYQTSTLQLKEYAKYFTEELAALQNSSLIWKALIGQQKQKVVIPSRQAITLKKDKAGLNNLPVTYDKDPINFIFDTGANISTVNASTAAAMNMKMLDVTFDVNAISGIKVQSGLAIAPKFSIASIEIENAVFLVFPDSALFFQPIDYQINGIIGYPIIAALKEIQMTQSGQMIVPKSTSVHQSQNMAMMFLTPLVQLTSQRDTLVFTFDTGADATTLYEDYFKKYREEIEANYTLAQMSMGGAGGKIKAEGYYIQLPLTVGNKEVVLDSVQLLKENLVERDHIYGNIGQDLITKFDTLVINLEEMFLLMK